MANGHQPFKASSHLGLHSTPSVTGPEGDSESFVKGAVLIDDGAGLLDEAGTTPIISIVGIATRDANNDTNNSDLRVEAACPNQLFEGTLDDGSSEGTGVSAETDQWAEYGVTEDSDGFWFVDKNKTEGDPTSGAVETCVVVTKIYGTIGDTTPQVQFMFLPAATIFGGVGSRET